MESLASAGSPKSRRQEVKRIDLTPAKRRRQKFRFPLSAFRTRNAEQCNCGTALHSFAMTGRHGEAKQILESFFGGPAQTTRAASPPPLPSTPSAITSSSTHISTFSPPTVCSTRTAPSTPCQRKTSPPNYKLHRLTTQTPALFDETVRRQVDRLEKELAVLESEAGKLGREIEELTDEIPIAPP